MHNVQQIAPDVFWVGASDRRLERFENLFPLPAGITYNSYVILDEKTALLDTVDAAVSGQFWQNLEAVLQGRPLDYLVINHMEPDHCAEVALLCQHWPKLRLVGNAKTFQLLGQFFLQDLSEHFYEVKEGDELDLGSHRLRFGFAPMVHWPEVMFTYECSQDILFSADAFGTFGAFAGNLFNDDVHFERDFLDEARRYYANIVGKYGNQVQAALRKFSHTEVKMICPLHGPVWRSNIKYILGKYKLWSAYRPERPGVVVAYGSMYGHTENAAGVLANKLAQRGVQEIRMYDLSKTHLSYVISDIFKYSHLVLAAPTYNMGLYLPMNTLLEDMAALNVQNRKVVVLGNGSWAPAAPTLMQKKLEEMKEMTLLHQPMLIKSALRPEQEAELDSIADCVFDSLRDCDAGEA